MTNLIEKTVPSPVGALRLVGNGSALVGVYFPKHHPDPRHSGRVVAADDVLDFAAHELAEYFAGRGRTFTTPLQMEGTSFQREVWAALTTIPYGERCSYRRIAESMGRPGAVRAVGAANARNPVSILVPCHRVVAEGGALTGYAGGLDAKRWLLAFESGTSERIEQFQLSSER